MIVIAKQIDCVTADTALTPTHTKSMQIFQLRMFFYVDSSNHINLIFVTEYGHKFRTIDEIMLC